MYFRNSVTIGLWFTVLFSANITAKETVIYRWLDSNNVVHYSQHQPKSGEYTQLTTVSSFQTNEKKPIKSNDISCFYRRFNSCFRISSDSKAFMSY